MSQTKVTVPFVDQSRFINITGDHPLKKGSTVERDMKDVRYVVLHQTACRLGTKPKRYFDVACHCAVLKDGTVLYVNNLKHTVYHGHGYNSKSIGIEIDGHFPGIEGDDRTIWKGPGSGPTHEVTPEQIKSTKNLLHWLVGESTALGGGFTKLVAHRQGSNQRQGDPGSTIWNAVAPWARDKLGLEIPWYHTIHRGMYLPRQWEIGSFFGWSEAIDRTGIGMLQILCNEINEQGLVVDGITGPKTRAAVAKLNEFFRLGNTSAVRTILVEKLVKESPEYSRLVEWMDRMVKFHKIPDHLRGNDLFDILESYPNEPE